MRILVVDTYYPAFLDAHYSARCGLSERPYNEQLDSLMAENFGTSDAYSRNLLALGHEASEIVANCVPLQVSWVRERGIDHGLRRRLARLGGPVGLLARRSLLRTIALEQIDERDPDVVYLQDLWFFKARDLKELRSRGRLVVGQIASALPPERTLRGFDLLISSFPHYVARFRLQGFDSEYLGLGFDVAVRDRLRECGIGSDPGDDREYPITLVGGLDPSLYTAVTPALERVALEHELHVWGYNSAKLSADSILLRNYHGEAWGLKMYEVLARSRIALNRHNDTAEGFANNMRLFEATGVGALLVTEAASNLADLFEPGIEIVAYENGDDLVDKLSYYLEHDDERRSIAAAGQARTLRTHSFTRRMSELAEILEARLAKRSRPKQSRA